MKKKILIVDNNPLILQLMTDLLKDEGYQVLTAEDGLSALDILRTYKPDVFFIDLVMPNIDGKKLCQIIRGMPELKDVFIVAHPAEAFF
jgi:CheY-like chemotaxis protein